MARKPQIRYFRSRGAYYCQINGMQNHLATGPDDGPDGPTFRAAARKFASFLEDAAAEISGNGNALGLVIHRYLQFVEANRSANTARLRHQRLAPFVRAFGEVKIGQLRAIHVTRFLTEMRAHGQRDAKGAVRPWGDATVRAFLVSLHVALNWAALPANGLIPSNPLRGYESPKQRSRGRESLVSEDTHKRLLERARKPVSDILLALRETGCRPGELLQATALDWSDELGAIVYHREATRAEGEGTHKGDAKNERIIMFLGDALAMMRERVKRYPTGTLFRTQTGEAYENRDLEQWFAYHREALGIPGLVPYSYRHTFATDWLQAGRNVDQLAALMGNSVGVIRSHYAHLLGEPDKLRAQLQAFKKNRDDSANPPDGFRIVG